MKTKAPKKITTAERAAIKKLAADLRPAKTYEELHALWVKTGKRHTPREWVVYAEKLALLNEGYALTGNRPSRAKAKKAVTA